MAATGVNDTAVVVPPGCEDYSLDLESALGIAGVQNPTINLALEAVRASQAELEQARALLLPNVNAGVTWDVHDGNLLASSGIVRDLSRDSMYAGAGAGTRSAETVPIPGVRIFTHLSDAIFEPHAAGHEVAARRFDAAATRNDVLLDVVTRYFALVSAEARWQVIRQVEQDMAEVVRLTDNFAKAREGRQGDADRAATDALLLHAQEQKIEEDMAVASAELARLLSMDPAVRLHGYSGTIPLIQLVDPNEDLEKLLAVALQNRPEVVAQTQVIERNRARLQEERFRPFLPLVSVGVSGGDFGGGSNLAANGILQSDGTILRKPRFGSFAGRTDFDVFAVWTLQNLGFGNCALQRQRRTEVEQAETQRQEIVDQIRRQVADAQARAAARLREVEIAQRRIAAAGQGFRLDVNRARNLEGLPIELLNSLNSLVAARFDLIRAAVGYNQAQFQLFVALGQPPTLVLANSNPCPAGAR